MSDPAKPAVPNDFEAASAVSEALKPLPKPRQELVLRWVAESLGIIPPQSVAPPPPVFTPPPVTVPVGGQQPGAQPAIDIASFVTSKNPKTDIQFVTTVAYYYRFIAPQDQRAATINVKSAMDATRLAGRAQLINARSTLNNAKAQGYLDSVGTGEFSVNSVGENLVVRGLPGDAAPASAAKKKKKGAGKKSTGKKKAK